MSSHQSNILIALHEADKRLTHVSQELSKLEKDFSLHAQACEKKKLLLAQVKERHAQASNYKAEEQGKLDLEQIKIADRRKQLSSMSGAKSAKLIEREMGIAQKMVDTLEENILSALQKEEDIEAEMMLIEKETEQLIQKKESAALVLRDTGGVLAQEIDAFTSKRNDLILQLEERTASLYKRVEKRYKGDAIAFAESGSCKSCFRALPAQTFNQIIAGYNLIQCPGCSRLLVHGNSQATEHDSNSKDHE